MPNSFSANYSQTNGERKVVDNASSFIIGEGSNLTVGKVENTAGIIGTKENGKLSIDEYIGHNLENKDETKTIGGSISLSPSSQPVSGVGINYANKDLESVTKNTVIGNVEIGKSSGAEINRDINNVTEVTKDEEFKTDISVESQTIKYITNPDKFKEDLGKAKDEIKDIGSVVENTVNPKGLDDRNIFENLRAQRWNTSFYNVIGSRAEELEKAFKENRISAEEYKEAVREIIRGYGKDIGVDFEVVYLDEATMPKASKGSTGSAYILDEKNKKVLIPIDVNKIGDTGSLWGVVAEEISHGKDGLEGRQDKAVANDPTNKEEGLESLGRPINDYTKEKLGEGSNISLTTDGIDLTNANVGEKVGDVITPEDRKFRKDYIPPNKIEITFDTIADFFNEGMEKDFVNLKKEDNILKYKKIYEESLDENGDMREAKRDVVKEMSKGVKDRIMLSEVSKSLLSVYGAPKEIRDLLLKEEEVIVKNKKKTEIREVLILNDIISEKKWMNMRLLH